MKEHPDREEWVPYLFGEADPQTRKHLAAHLNACPQCAEELRGWRHSLQRLDAWKMADRQRRRRPNFSPALNLAAAAVLVLGIGFGVGRWFSAAAERGQSRHAMESSVRAAFNSELREQVRRELASQWQARLEQLQQDSTNALSRMKSETVAAAAAETSRALEQLIAAVDSGRAEDQRDAASWVEELRRQHDTDFVTLRKDLETVATTTDDQIRAAHLKLIELTSFTTTSDLQH